MRKLLVLGLLVVAAVGFYFIQGWNGAGPAKTPVDVVIPRGATLVSAANRLKKAGAIGSTSRFLFQAKLFGGGKGIKATDQTKLKEIGRLVAAFPVEPTDQIMLVSDGGQLIRVPVGQVRMVSRASKGVRIFNTADGERVVSVEHITDIGEPVDLVVGDLSFISLTLVLDALIGVCAADADLALMVKPQFEVGKERVGKGGVVRDPALRAEAVAAVATRAAGLGWGARAVARSPLPGPSGNVEFFLWLRAGPATLTEHDIHTAVHA